MAVAARLVDIRRIDESLLHRRSSIAAWRPAASAQYAAAG
jgi:hypothetical protein